MQGNDFVQSAMYKHGVTCFSCHDVHGTGNNADLIKPAKQLCLTCHGPNSPNGPHAASIEAHTHHKADSTGSECVACHMPKIQPEIADVNVRSHTFKFITAGLTDDFKIPNPCLSCHADRNTGWVRDNMPDAGGANYGLGRHEVDFLTPAGRGIIVDPPDGTLPVQPWAKTEMQNRKLPERGYDDPTAHCFVAGVPRSMYIPAPLQILQPPGYLVVLHERMSWRSIALDGRPHLPDSIRLWQGDSIGKWDGDTLVVETTNLNGKTWLNEVGEIVSHAERVIERFTPIDGNTIRYQATVSDPLVYTRPWTIAFDLNRQKDELLEVACHEDNQDLQHLKDLRDEARRKRGGS